MTDTESLAREALERAQNWLDRSPDKDCRCGACTNARELIRLGEENERLRGESDAYNDLLGNSQMDVREAESDNTALREENTELNEAIKGWEAAERAWAEIRAGMERDNAALRARVERLETALEHYAHDGCEGWCLESGGYFDDCMGCPARQSLAAPVSAGIEDIGG